MNKTQNLELETCKLFLQACRAHKSTRNMSFMLKTQCGTTTEYAFFSPKLYKTIYITKKAGNYSVRIDGMMHVDFPKNHSAAICAAKLIAVVEKNKRREKEQSLREQCATIKIMQKNIARSR